MARHDHEHDSPSHDSRFNRWVSSLCRSPLAPPPGVSVVCVLSLLFRIFHTPQKSGDRHGYRC